MKVSITETAKKFLQKKKVSAFTLEIRVTGGG
jgi:hypothetical protein